MIKSNRRHTLFAHNKHRKKDNNNTIDFDDFFKKATILPNNQKPKQLEQDEDEEEEVVQAREDNKVASNNEIEQDNYDNTESSQYKPTTIETLARSAVDTGEILKGVIACIDVRTEDGDDVSQKFELAIQSMGGETRKMFSDIVTHLVFKNGSNATLKKAMNKNIYIINLLWISKCQSEGKRLDEKDFLIERPLGLILTAKRRPKSMKPSKVKGLTVNSNDQDDEEMEEGLLNNSLLRLTSDRRYTFDLSEFKTRFDQDKRVSKKQRTEEELYSLEQKEKEKEKEIIPKSSVSSAENIADRHNNNNINKKEENEIIDRIQLMPLNNESVKKHIKASFSIGHSTITNAANAPTIDLPSSLLFSPTTNAPLKRKRKPTSSHSSPSLSSNVPSKSEKNVKTAEIVDIEKMDIEEEVTRLPIISSPSPSPPPPSFTTNEIYIGSKQTIVLTSLTKKQRMRCENTVNRLGRFEIVLEVDERTTHVIVGKQRRTKTVVLGLLRGAYLLKPEWLFDVEDEEKYTPENYYELINWYPSSSERKSTRLLSSNMCIFINSTLSGVDLIREFIELAGGTVVHSQEKANIIISEEFIKNSKKPVVSDLWIYESVDVWKNLPVDKYLVK